MKRMFLGAALACLLASSAAAAQSVIVGMARAGDGDSLSVGDRKIRLFGIDAPELDQTCERDGHLWPCGAQAASKLSALVTGKTIRCEALGTDQYGRTLARCMAGATDVNRTMVALGLAIAYRRYASDYVSAENSAKGNRLGLWAGKFEMPTEYRRAERASRETRNASRRSSARPPKGPASPPANANCNIKGNRNRKGQWIYHLPGMPYYEQTRAEEIFCTEAEAQAAGYRRAIVR